MTATKRLAILREAVRRRIRVQDDRVPGRPFCALYQDIALTLAELGRTTAATHWRGRTRGVAEDLGDEFLPVVRAAVALELSQLD